MGLAQRMATRRDRMSKLSAETSLATAIALSGLGIHVLWVRYAALGGCQSPDELDAYVNGDHGWAAAEHDIAAHALNEGCADLGPRIPHRLRP